MSQKSQDLRAETLKPRSPLPPLKQGGTLKAPFLRELGELFCVSPKSVTYEVCYRTAGDHTRT